MRPLPPLEALHRGHAALVTGAIFGDLGPRTQIEVRGADRYTFLHGLCTNDVKSLIAGQGREAFFTNVQGKTIAHGFIFDDGESLTIDTTADQAPTLVPALDRYIVREHVELLDCTSKRGEIVLAGPLAESLLADRFGVQLPEARLSHTGLSIAGCDCRVRRVDWLGPQTFFLCCARDAFEPIQRSLAEAGAAEVYEETIEAARIEARMPYYGRDITVANLPQEVGRDAVAISFNKGCYLGQETVARIDALGHVNRYLALVQFAGYVIPDAGLPLMGSDASTAIASDAKPLGEVTSAAFSPRFNAPIALAYVRRGHHTPCNVLHSAAGDATVQ
jgi:folate-binding protein YgfZ